MKNTDCIQLTPVENLLVDRAARLASANAYQPKSPMALIALFADIYYGEGADAFAEYVMDAVEEIRPVAEVESDVVDVLVAFLKKGASEGSAVCANNLGALYYLGQLLPQNYVLAAELYEVAADMGCHQALVNLGYIYEYGRVGLPDLFKAYQCFSLASVLYPTCESFYKLGDMYSRGKAFRKDLASAYQLWCHALSLAEGEREAAHPALRLAKLMCDKSLEELGITYDPLQALVLYQRAEIGMRLCVNDGERYYLSQLQEAIEGQAHARALLA